MLALIRRHKWWFVLLTAAAIAFRVFFLLKFRLVDGDSFIYGDIAKNWLQHGVFGVSTQPGPTPTYIRLPGYPALLAAIWAITGVEHYTAVLIVQLAVDVLTCFVIADLARRTISERAARIAFVLTAFCPFLAEYVAAPLTETLTIFATAVALDAAVAGMDELASGKKRAWVACGLALAYSILLRPDSGILLAVIGAYLLIRWAWPGQAERQDKDEVANPVRRPKRGQIVAAAVIVAAIALAPLVPWTIRNWHDFHRFQPLAPRYANAPDEPVNYGFERWTKTWMVDFVSVSEIYWEFPDAPIDVNLLPSRAFDDVEERQRTERIFQEYNDRGHLTAAMDAEFGKLAQERITRAPFRYYISLPAARIADMWFRPRTAMFGINDRWWEYRDDPHGARWGTFLGVLNLLFVGLAVVGLRHRAVRFAGLLIAFVVVRSLFLGTLENPETRYTLECFPVVLAFAAAAFERRGKRHEFGSTESEG